MGTSQFTSRKEYLSTPLAGTEIKLLQFWKNNEGRWPKLAKMAKQYLAAPASTAGEPQHKHFQLAADVACAVLTPGMCGAPQVSSVSSRWPARCTTTSASR